MTFALLILGVAALTCTVVLVTAAFQIGGHAPFAAATLVVAAAVVVGESILLSLVHLLTRPALLIAQAVCLIAAWAAWRRRGRPRPPPIPPPAPKALLRTARSQPVLAVLVLAVVLALALQATLAVAVAPNESDSVAYHLPRAAFWVQNHTALQYRPGVLDDPRQAHPPNAELLVAWTMAMSRSDRYAQLVQWFAMLGVVAVILSATRLVGLSRPQAVLAAGLFALMPVALIQSATTQNDLLLAFFLTAALFFAVSGLRSRTRGPLLVAALAAGLAAGTKLDVVFIVPAALLILVPTIRRERPQRSLVLFGAAAAVASVVALGSFNYVQNEIHTHTVTGWTGTPSGDFIRTNPLTDAARISWNMVEVPGVATPDWLADPAQGAVRALFGHMQGSYFAAPYPAIRTYASADDSGYGLVGLLIVLPLLATTIVRRRVPPWQRLLALSAAGYFAAYTVTLGYNPETGRYLLPAMALAAPLLGLLARRRAWAAIAVALALATLPNVLLHENYKPVLSGPESKTSIFTHDRLAQQSIDDTYLLRPLRRLATFVGPHDALGFVYQDDLAEYELFGEPLQRRLVGFSTSNVTAQDLRMRGLRGLFIGFANEPPCAGRFCVPRGSGLRFIPLGRHAFLAEPN